MELLRVNDVKMKIVLTAEDVRRFHLDTGCDGFESAGSKEALFAVLEEAKERSDFDVEREKLLVQIYPLPDGGCELFVTKLGRMPSRERELLERSKNVTLAGIKTLAFRFEHLKDLALASKMLVSGGCVTGSEVYLTEEENFVLILKERYLASRLSGSVKLCEFGKSLPEKAVPYVREHGKCLAPKSAIELFKNL